MTEAPAVVETVRSPLAQEHVSSGAKLAAYHGAEVPASFVDVRLEHQAVRSAAGIFDFSFRSRFSLSGEHRVRFLHRIVSNNIQALVPGQGAYATLLSAQGRILADLRIYLDEERIWLDTDADLAEKAMGILRRYIIGERVQVEPSGVQGVSVQGPASWSVITGLFGSGTQPLDHEMDHRFVEREGQGCRIVRLSSTGEQGYEIWAEPGDLPGLWAAARQTAAQARPCGVEALEVLRIEAGIPRYGYDLAEDTLPLEAGLLSALSFNKGCYIGQEIVERMRTRGHANWQLMGARFDPGTDVPERGETLAQGGKVVGEVTSSCESLTLGQPVALAYVRREVAAPGTRLQRAGGAEGQVYALPLVKASPSSEADLVLNR